MNKTVILFFSLSLAFLIADSANCAKLETSKWQAAIDQASAAGGGVVSVPAGDHHIGMLFLKSNVELRLEKGARLMASGNSKDFEAPTGVVCGNPCAVIAAVCATNIAVTGEGEIFGNAWAYDYSQNERRPMGLALNKCQKVRLESFTLRDAAAWGINIFQCENVHVRRIKINSHAGHCTDGIDIEGKNILIEECDVDSGDDSYCLKSHDVKYAVENVVVRDCIARTHCNAFKIGTATHGIVRNVAFVNCRALPASRVYRDLAPMPKDLLNWKVVEGALWYHCGPGFGCINIECVDGGLVENIVADNIEMEGYQTPIFVRGGDRHGFNDGHEDTTQGGWFTLRNIVISNIRGRADGRTPSTITGAGKCRPRNVTLKNICLEIPGEGKNDKPYSWPGEDKAGAYPQTNMFDAYHLPAYGLFVDKVDGITMENVKFTLRSGTSDLRPQIWNKEK